MVLNQHHNALYYSVKTACLGKIELNAKMLSPNQIAGFLNFNISKTIKSYKVDFLHAGAYLIKLQIDVILGGHG